MADESAEDEQEHKRTSPIMVIVFVLVSTLIAGGAGFSAGQIVFAPMIAAGSADTDAEAPKAESAQVGSGYGDQAETDGQAEAEQPLRGIDYSKLAIVDLDPITTNIAAPQDIWVRIELSIAASSDDGETPAPALVEAVQADFLAYMRTVRLQSISLPSGFQHLVTDLERLAATRSSGEIKQVFVKALLLE